MNEEELLDKYAYIISSSYRNKVMNELYGDKVFKTPSKLADECDIHRKHISKILMDLKREELVHCINENRRKGRLYSLTDEGRQVCDFILTRQEHIYKPTD